MSWYYWKLPRHPVSKEKFETRGRNTIILRYHYRVDPNLGKVVCVIFRIPCACPACVDQLDKYCLTNFSPSSKTGYVCVEFFHYFKALKHYNYWIILELLENKTPQL